MHTTPFVGGEEVQLCLPLPFWIFSSCLCCRSLLESLKNKNKLHEMVDIMDKLQEYVPTLTRTKMFELPQTGEEFAFHANYFHHRWWSPHISSITWGAVTLEQLWEPQTGCLTGLAPVTEDWHAKVCLLVVSAMPSWCIMTLVSCYELWILTSIIGDMENSAKDGI